MPRASSAQSTGRWSVRGTFPRWSVGTILRGQRFPDDQRCQRQGNNSNSAQATNTASNGKSRKTAPQATHVGCPRSTAPVGTFRTPKPIFSATCLQLKHRLRASGSSSAASCSQYSRLLNFLLTERVGYISIMEHYFGLSLEIQILASSRRLPTQSGQQGLAGMENPIYILRQDHG